MALGRSAIRNVDGQTTISNTATSFRTTLSDILASVTKAALLVGMIQVRAGSTSILKFNFLLGAILPGPGLSKVVRYPQELRAFRPWRLAELSVADRHFQHHLPGLLGISLEGTGKHERHPIGGLKTTHHPAVLHGGEADDPFQLLFQETEEIGRASCRERV